MKVQLKTKNTMKKPSSSGATKLWQAETPHIELRARGEKARRGALVPIPGHPAAELAEYIAKRKERVSGNRDATMIPVCTACTASDYMHEIPPQDTPEYKAILASHLQNACISAVR